MLYKDVFMFVKILTVFVLIFGVVSFASAHSRSEERRVGKECRL